MASLADRSSCRTNLLLGFVAIGAAGIASAQNALDRHPAGLLSPLDTIPSGLSREKIAALFPEGSVEASEPQIVWRRDVPWYPADVMFSADGRRVATLHQNTVSLFDTVTGRLVDEDMVNDAPGVTRTIAVSATGKLGVVTPSSVDSFELGSAKPFQRIPCPLCDFSALAFSPDGRTVALQRASTYDERMGAVRVVDWATRSAVQLEAAASSTKVSFSKDGRQLLATHVTREGELGFRIWDTSDWRVLRTAAFPKRTMGSIATGAVRGADFVAVHGNDGNVELRDLDTDAVLWSAALIPPQFARSLSGVTGRELYRVAIAPDGSWVVSYERPGGNDTDHGAIVVRRMTDGAILAVYPVRRLTSLAISPNSETFGYAADLNYEGQIAIVRVIPAKPLIE